QSERIQSLKARYSLDEALPDSSVVNEERAQLAGPDRGAMRSVVAALCEELVRVKDSLDLFVRSDRKALPDLEALQVPLKQIADTLAVLGFGQPRKIVLDQIGVIQALMQGVQTPDDAVLMDMAGALLYVEATLAGMVGGMNDGRGEESHLPTTDVAQIHQLVIREARTGLEQAKDAIIEFIASQWDHQHLVRVPDLLTQSRGGLVMIPLERAAALLDACNRYIQEQLLARQAIPDWQSLDTLADAITSVEYYLERLSEDCGSQGDLILDVAEESLRNLGYPLHEKPSILELEDFGAPVNAAPADQPVEDSLLPEAEPETQGSPLLEQDGTELFELDVEPDQVQLPQPELDNEEPEYDLADLQPEAVEFEQPIVEATDSATLEMLDEGEADYLVDWSEAEMAELQMPKVDLPEMAVQVQPVEQPISMEEVMAAPVVAINPPAQDMPPSLLPPPADEEPVDEELLEVFIEEAAEVLETIG